MNGNMLIDKIKAQVSLPSDSPELKAQKSYFVLYSLAMSAVGLLWGIMYLAFGEARAAAIPISYGFISLFFLFIFIYLRNFDFFRNVQLTLILLLPFVLQIVLGGFFNSSAVVLWSLAGPFVAFVFSGQRQALIWSGLYVLMILFSGLIQPYVRLANNLTTETKIWFFVFNIVTVSGFALALINYYIRERDKAFSLLGLEQKKTEALLLNVLPRSVADILKNETRTIAERYENVSILFADMVGFTPLSAEMSPEATVELLNEIYSHLDELVDKFGLEKIRTIGDNYMVASGVPVARKDHAQALADFALMLCAYVDQFSKGRDLDITFRVGINSGPVVGGVVGRRKFHFDIWGDPVNIASRLESQGVPGRIQISSSTYDLIKTEFDCEERGFIEIKGRGSMPTWFLMGRKTPYFH